MTTDVEVIEAGVGEASARRRMRLWIEFCVLFLLPPVPMWLMRDTFGFLVIPMLVAGLVVCGAFLVTDRTFDNRRLGFNGMGVRGLRAVLLAFVPLAAAAGVCVWLLLPHRFLAFPRQNTETWAMIMVLYPVFSVYPQEVIFRAFIFHRYRAIFRSDWAKIVASAIVFGLAHTMFNTWIAVVMTIVGGLLFAWTYARTRSTVFAAIEHALWGDFIFTIGLGAYFYGGSALVQS